MNGRPLNSFSCFAPLNELMSEENADFFSVVSRFRLITGEKFSPALLPTALIPGQQDDSAQSRDFTTKAKEH